MGCGSSRRVQVMTPDDSEVVCNGEISAGWVLTASLPMHFEVLLTLPSSLDHRTGNNKKRFLLGEVQGVCPSSGELLVATKAGLVLRVARSDVTVVSVTKRAHQLPPALENRIKDM